MNAPRPLALLLALLALLPLLWGAADAGRRSGGGFGGASRGSSRSYTPRSNPYRSAPRYSPYTGGAGSSAAASALSRWRSLRLPAGVNRSALTYSPSRSSAYPYGFGGRYYPYPQSYYQQHGLGSLLGSAVLAGVAGGAVTSALNSGSAPVIAAPFAPERPASNPWPLLGLLALGGGWLYMFMRRRR